MESGMEKKTIKKNDIYTIEIEDLSTDGSGIGKIDGYTLFVKDALIGDTAEVKVIKTKKNYGYGRLMRIITPSPDRVEAPCPHARSCGGCQIQHLSFQGEQGQEPAEPCGTCRRLCDASDHRNGKTLLLPQ